MVPVRQRPFTGFIGHTVKGDFNPSRSVISAFIAIIGGELKGRFAFKTKPVHIKRLFAYTNWIAAICMILNAFYAVDYINGWADGKVNNCPQVFMATRSRFSDIMYRIY
jgi:hypothetical protein